MKKENEGLEKDLGEQLDLNTEKDEKYNKIEKEKDNLMK